jgi:hypothetical protein
VLGIGVIFAANLKEKARLSLCEMLADAAAVEFGSAGARLSVEGRGGSLDSVH